MYKLNKEELTQLFLIQSKTCKEIGEYYNLPTITIQRHLRKFNIKKPKQYKPSYEKIVELLEQGNTQVSIAKLYNVSKYTISKLINKTRKFESINQIDDSKIDESSEIFWYLVGLISSDGHITDTNYIQIFQTNLSFLNKLGKFFGHTGKVYSSIASNSTNNKIYILPLYSEKLKLWFVERGFETDKRYNCPFLSVPIEYMKYYIRGMFDGDGCLHYRFVSGELVACTVDISSASEEVLVGLQNILAEYNPKRHIVNTKKGQCERITITTKKEIENFLNWIYSGKYLDLCLFRKYRSYLMLLEIFKLQESVHNKALSNIETNTKL